MEVPKQLVEDRNSSKSEGVGEQEDFLVGLLEQYSLGKSHGSSGKNVLLVAAATAAAAASPSRKEDKEDKDGSDWSRGNQSTHGGASSVSSRSEIGIDEAWEVKSENLEDQNGSTGKTNDRLAENSLSLPNTEQSADKVQENAEDGEVEEEKNLNQETSEKLDLEELLATQETYDLYCPNCNSCVTRRVILKERTRGQHESPEQPKCEKLDAVDEPESPSEGSDVSSDSEEEPETSRCQRFFIRLGLGFGFFYPSGDENMVTSTQEGARKRPSRWFYLFGKNGREPVQQPVDERHWPKSESENIPPSDPNSEAIENQEPKELYREREDTVGPPATAGEKPEKDPTAENASSRNVPGEIDAGVANFNSSTPLKHEEYDVVSAGNKRPLQKGFVRLRSKLLRIFGWWKLTADTNQITSNLKIVEDKVDDADEVRVVSGNITAPAQPRKGQEKNVLGLEILKSIVYGGLDENIKSLGIVSSAAGSGAKTLNILALGLANVVGGLTMLAHNLRDLKNENGKSVTGTSEEREDRYRELLGRRENFRLHIFLAVLSYIFFGLIPPLVYTFSFRQTRIENYKLVSVLSVSLVCVILLSIGKAYVRKPPKSYIKTVVYYTNIVVASSGISYVAGDIAGKFIEEFGWFKPNQACSTSVSEGIKPGKPDFAAFLNS